MGYGVHSHTGRVALGGIKWDTSVHNQNGSVELGGIKWDTCCIA